MIFRCFHFNRSTAVPGAWQMEMAEDCRRQPYGCMDTRLNLTLVTLKLYFDSPLGCRPRPVEAIWLCTVFFYRFRCISESNSSILRVKFKKSKMYSGIVEPHFRFRCLVWGCCGVTKLQTLQNLQNQAARIVTKSNFDTPSIGLIQSLNWPTVSDIIRDETATTVYKSLNGLVPEYLSSLFEKRSTRNVRELRNTETDLSIPLRKLTMGRELYLFVDLSFEIALNLMLNRHHLLPPLREESNRKLVTFVPRPPEKQFSWTDGATVPKKIKMNE